LKEIGIKKRTLVQPIVARPNILVKYILALVHNGKDARVKNDNGTNPTVQKHFKKWFQFHLGLIFSGQISDSTAPGADLLT